MLTKYYIYFTTDNKSGKKTKEFWLKKNNPDLYNIINNKYINLKIPFKEKVYLFINNLLEPPKCPVCGKYVNFRGDLKKGYNKYCSINCLNKSQEHKNKIKKTYLKKYDVESHNQVNSVKQKKKKTLIKNYGVDNPMKSKVVKKTYINNLIKNYGVDNPMKINNIINNRQLKIYNGSDKNILRVIDKLKNDYDFIKHENGLFYFKCKKCGDIFNININLLNGRLMLNIPICLKCNPQKSYNYYFYNFIETLNIPFIKNDRNILDGKELDVYIYSKNLGIEFDGLYWHSNIYKDKNYHLNKTNLAESKGIQLIHIFEDEWVNKPDIVKSIIKSKLGIFNDRIYARKTIIKKVDDNNLIRTFLNENHIQGFIGSKVKIGLFYNDELVSLMTFGSLRRSMGQKENKEGYYEMLRFATKLNTQVIGGASKMLNYFIKNYHPKEILTYADRRYSNGKLYLKLGFDFIKKTEPNYWYIKKNQIKREYRFKYRKDVLIKEGFDKNKTEKEIMLERGYYHIYDCGMYKYKKTI